MEEDIRVVQQFYDNTAQTEWERLEKHQFEFIITTRMMDRYIKPGDRILDIGDGPGRYSIYYARKGCEVTLVDLSSGNVKAAFEKAADTSCGGDAFIKAFFISKKDILIFMKQFPLKKLHLLGRRVFFLPAREIFWASRRK